MTNFKTGLKRSLWIIFVLFPIGLVALPVFLASMLIEPVCIWATQKLYELEGYDAQVDE